ncbi:MAG: YafY family transcriptional regulator [Firmicutes bacterium]|nr:YafY family transcriptional regulator [Bacillota bacterium]
MQTNRLFEIIYTLLDKKTVPARELAARFGVSTRTIYRDIDTLSLAGIPVYTEKGKGGGISLLPDFVLNKSILNEQEQNEILSALQGLQAVKAIETDKVLQKLSSIFNKNITPWLDVDFTGWSHFGEEIFNGFKHAILEKKIVSFDYYGAYGDKTSREIEPVQLQFQSRTWYVHGYCLMRQGMRLFKLSRVRDLTVTTRHYPLRDLCTVPQNESQPSRQRPMVTLKIKISPEMTYRLYDDFPPGELQPDGSHIVTTTWPEDNWLYGFILSYGEYAEVLEPQHIRDIIKEKAHKIMQSHS